MSRGDYRIAGRDAKSGVLLYDVTIPTLLDGAAFAAFTADGDEAFVIANESLTVIDGKTGAVTHRLTQF